MVGAILSAATTELVKAGAIEVARVVEIGAEDEAGADEATAMTELTIAEDEATTTASVEDGIDDGTAVATAAVDEATDEDPELEEPPGPETLVVRSPLSM